MVSLPLLLQPERPREVDLFAESHTEGARSPQEATAGHFPKTILCFTKKKGKYWILKGQRTWYKPLRPQTLAYAY